MLSAECVRACRDCGFLIGHTGECTSECREDFVCVKCGVRDHGVPPRVSHGVYAYRKYSCRCNDCVTAKRQLDTRNQRKYRARVRSQKETAAPEVAVDPAVQLFRQEMAARAGRLGIELSR